MAILNLSPHTLVIIIGENPTILNRKTDEIYSKMLFQSPYVKQISLEQTAKILIYSDTSPKEVARAQRSAIGIVLAAIHSMCTDSVPPLVMLVNGVFTEQDIQRFTELSYVINYSMQFIFIEPDINANINSTIGTWSHRICQEVENSWTINKIKILATEDLEIYLDLGDWHKCQLQDRNWWIVGDIHGCYTELLKLFSELKWNITEGGLLEIPEDMGLIFVGDLVDRGPGSREVIEFISRNIGAGREIRLVTGNHEIVNMAYLTDPSIKTDLHHYDTISILKSDPVLAAIFRSLVNISTPFVQYISNSVDKQSFIVTHSVCNKRFRGHLDGASFSQQNYITDPMLTNNCYSSCYGVGEVVGGGNNILSKLKLHGYIGSTSKDAVALFNEPIHYSGHLTIDTVYYSPEDSIVLLDTGCVYGGSLSAICHTDKRIISIPSIISSIETFNDISRTNSTSPQIDYPYEEIDLACQLDEDTGEIFGDISNYYTIKNTISNSGDVRIIEPTHSSMLYVPCPPNAGKIECLDTPLHDFLDSGVTEVFAHAIPHGEIMTVRITAGGDLPGNISKELLALHKSLKNVMETYQVEIMDIIIVREDKAIYPDYSIEIQRLEQRLLDNTNNGKSELSTGKTLELYEKAQAIKMRVNSFGRPGKYYPIDVSSMIFSNGMLWNPSIKDKNWGSASWRYKTLCRGSKSGSLMDSCVLKLNALSIVESADRITKMSNDAREAFAILIQSNTSTSYIYKLRTPRGLLLEYGPLYNCNVEYNKAAKKWIAPLIL